MATMASTTDDWAFVLIHGGQHDRRCWDDLRPLLALPSLAPDLPGRRSRGPQLGDLRISQAVESVLAEISTVPQRNIVLVGHSLAGFVLPAVAARSARVRHVVYLACALAPAGGRASAMLLEDLPTPLRGLLRWATRGKTRLNLFRGTGPTRRLTVMLLGLGDAPVNVRNRELARLGPEEPNWLLDVPIVPSQQPRTWILPAQDRCLPPTVALRMMRRFPGGFIVRVIDGGHSVMVTRPRELATVLNEIAASARDVAAV